MKKRWFWFPVVLAVLAASPAFHVTLAQEADDAEESIEVFRLARMSAAMASQVVGEFFSVQNFPEGETNQLIVRASASQMPEIRKLLERLDAAKPASGGPASEPVVAIIRPKHRRLDEVTKIVGALISGGFSYAPDTALGQLVVRGSAQSVKAAQDLVQLIDVPRMEMRLELHVLGVGGGEVDPKIAKELQALGINNFGTLSQMVVVAMEGESFRMEESSDLRNVTMKGTAWRLEQPSNVEVKIALEMNIRAGGEQPWMNKIDLDSTLRTPVGEYCLIGVAPPGESGKDPVVLAVRVSQKEAIARDAAGPK